MTEAEDDERERYEFERMSEPARLPPARRSRSAAALALVVLRRRLAVPDGVVFAKDLDKLLLRYCSETILNIAWYEQARRREQRANAMRTRLMIVLMAIALGLLCASAFPPLDRPQAPSATTLPIALLAGGALTVLQVIAALGDGRARLAIFWKAGADLKEALYNFEHRWRGRVVHPGGVADAFEDELHAELKTARAVTRVERLEFFANLRSPSDVVGVAVTAVNSLRASRAEATTATALHTQQVAAARARAAEARADVLASEYRLRAVSDGAEHAASATALVNAHAEVVRAEAILHELISG